VKRLTNKNTNENIKSRLKKCGNNVEIYSPSKVIRSYVVKTGIH
jgi:hypothetical protein